MNRKIVVLSAVAGVAVVAQAGFGDFLRKAAAVTDIVTGTTNATTAVSSGEQTADAVTNPGRTATTAAQQATLTAQQKADEKTQAVTTAVADAEDVATLAEVKEIEMDELAKRMKKNPALLVIDVRSSGEYASGHIPRAKNIPVNSIGDKIGTVAPSKTTPIYVYCQSGNRSSAAAEVLVAKGYRKVYDAGGIGDWDGKLVR